MRCHRRTRDAGRARTGSVVALSRPARSLPAAVAVSACLTVAAGCDASSGGAGDGSVDAPDPARVVEELRPRVRVTGALDSVSLGGWRAATVSRSVRRPGR